MKKQIVLLLVSTFMLTISCTKSTGDANCDKPSSCFTCTNCQGQYGHLIDGQYCVQGFDNCEDWVEAKSNHENNSGCTCEYD